MTEISDNEKREIHLCEDCAHEQGLTLKGQVSLADFLAGLMKAPANKEIAKLAKIKCPVCGINYLEFQQKGRFGCPKDYEVFKKLVEPLLEKVHGSVEHVGKAPIAVGAPDTVRVRLAALRKRLAAAVTDENYELAAELRDEIKKLEDGNRAT